MLTSSFSRTLFPAALLVLSVVGCSAVPQPSVVPTQAGNPELTEVQAPTFS